MLKPGAEWRVASDDPTYQAWVADVMEGQTLFDAPPAETAHPPDWPLHSLRSQGTACRAHATLLDIRPPALIPTTRGRAEAQAFAGRHSSGTPAHQGACLGERGDFARLSDNINNQRTDLLICPKK